MTPEEIKNTDFETFFQAVPQMKEVHHIKATGQEIYHVYKNDVVYEFIHAFMIFIIFIRIDAE